MTSEVLTRRWCSVALCHRTYVTATGVMDAGKGNCILQGSYMLKVIRAAISLEDSLIFHKIQQKRMIFLLQCYHYF